jgi:hypothetical protein
MHAFGLSLMVMGYITALSLICVYVYISLYPIFRFFSLISFGSVYVAILDV